MVYLPDNFNWKNPDYTPVYRSRVAALNRLRARLAEYPAAYDEVRNYYRKNPVQFIIDWGSTTDPRNVEVDLPTLIPFILFPRQVEWCNWVLESWRSRRPGVNPKTRESGVSWLAVALSATLCLFNEGVSIGFGSRKEEYVDKIGAPKSLFWKARKFIEMLPVEFRNGFDLQKDAPFMRIQFHQTGSIITGEAGDNIGRGDRASIYFVDEAHHLEHPELTDAALSATTNCRIDVSTANGVGGPFYRKVTEWPDERVFRFHWRDDPRKDETWYAKQCFELDSVTLAQEIDINFAAAVEGVLIPNEWVQAAVDAHIKLGFEPTGASYGAFDVADEGRDKCAFVGATGVLLDIAEEWSGKGDDIFGSVQRAFELCAENGYEAFRYDSDGLGAGVRGDARVINEQRINKIQVEGFRGSAEVVNPEGSDLRGRQNQDVFMNFNVQSWWDLRVRFQKTFRMVSGTLIEGKPAKYHPDELISIDSGLKLRGKLLMELSQPTYTRNTAGKFVVEKTPEGTRSPNLADAVKIRFARMRPFIIATEARLRASRIPMRPSGVPAFRRKRF